MNEPRRRHRAGRGVAPMLMAMAAWLLTTLLPAARADDELDAVLETMARLEIVDTPAAWRERATKGRFCDGAEVAELLLALAAAFEPVGDVDQAIAALSRRNIVWNDYWRHNAVAGRPCEGEYVANLLRAAAGPLGDRELCRRFPMPDGVIPGDEPSAFATVRTTQGRGSCNTVVATQTIDATYRFTRKPLLVETAEAIRAMGCDTIKFQVSPRYAGRHGNVDAAGDRIRSLAQLVRDEPTHRLVLDMPFTRFVLWTHTFHLDDDQDKWRKGCSRATAEGEYREVYELACHLLRTYRDTGKAFYLGHWEGDGWLRGSIDAADDSQVDDMACRGMADWLNARQRAVDDAKRDTPHDGVEVWHYTEVNHVKLAMQGRPALVNRVLPNTNVDLVSYSCYDTQDDPALLKAALSFIESQLPEKRGITGRRVFIGEYGFPAIRHTPQEQDRLSRQVIRAGLEWGAPLILYWQLFNNEVEADGRQRGYWLVDDHGVKQPAYHTHDDFLAWASREVMASTVRSGRPPTALEFRTAAVDFLAGRPAGRNN